MKANKNKSNKKTLSKKPNPTSAFKKFIKMKKLAILSILVFAGVGGYILLKPSSAQNVVLYNGIDKYCIYHVMGSLYADGRGNGPPNGATWKVPHSYWEYKPPEKGQADRFQYCAELVSKQNGGIVERSNNLITLRNYKLDLPFDDLPSSLLKQTDKNAYRAFLTSVVEGEGNSAGKIDDNFKCIDGKCNDIYAHHVISLATAINRAGMGYFYTKGDDYNCTAKIKDNSIITRLSDFDPLNDNYVGGLAVCINSSDIDLFASLPHAACTSRVPGGVIKCNQLVLDNAPPNIPNSFRAVEVTSNYVKLTWDASQDDSGIKRYRMRRDGEFYVGVTPPNTSYTDYNVVKGKTYKYQISATDNNGNQSKFSEAVSVTIPLN